MSLEILQKLSTEKNLETIYEINEIKDDVGTTNFHCSVGMIKICTQKDYAKAVICYLCKT